MNIAIVEDNAIEQRRLLEFINKSARRYGIKINYSIFNNGLKIIDQYQGNFDIIYFDVKMPIMDGMTAAKKIRKMDENVTIVFLTNYVQWAIDGYSVNAADFLLKPLTFFNFNEHFKKITHQLNKTTPTFLIKNSDGLKKVRLDDLYYVESEGHYLHFHTNKGIFSILDSMKNLEKKLQPNNFFRCNNGYLINLKYVNGVKGNLVHVGDYSLQISRPRRKDFMAALTNYIGMEG